MDGPVVKIKQKERADIRPDDLLNAEYKRKGKNYSLPDEDKVTKRQKSGFFGKSKEKVRIEVQWLLIKFGFLLLAKSQFSVYKKTC